MSKNYNTLSSLNETLFETLEKLNDEDLDEQELKKEITRSKAVAGIADKIISNAALMLRASELKYEYGSKAVAPAMIDYETKE